jgi:hypothetical protein
MKTKSVQNNLVSSAVRLNKIKGNGTLFIVNAKHHLSVTSKALDLLSSPFNFSVKLNLIPGHEVALLLEALHYKPEGHGHNPSGITMALGLTQPLTEMSTRNIFCGVKAAGA